MSLEYRGNKNGKHQVFETEPGVKLDFRGPDADKFAQVNAPKKAKKIVRFELTEKQFFELILPAEQATSWRVEVEDCDECGEHHTVINLLNDDDVPFAAASIGTAEDVDRLILALLGGCSHDARLKDLLAETRAQAATAVA